MHSHHHRAEQPQDTNGELRRSTSSSESSATSLALASLAAEAPHILAAAEIENYGATPATMSTPGSKAMTIGLTILLVSVSSAMHLGTGGFGLLLCFGGVLVGASLVAAGVRMVDGPVPNPIVQVVSRGARALAAFMHRNTAGVGLVMASCAFTVVSGQEEPVLCFGMFALLLLGLTLINIRARGE